MIDAVQELLKWMNKQGLDLKKIELTVHFPNSGAQHHCAYALQREVSLMALSPKASVPSELRIFGMPVHLEVRELGE